MMLQLPRLTLLWISFCSVPLAAQVELPLWELGLGMGLLHLPHYRGSDQYRDWTLPVPYFIYRGEVLRADREGAHAVLVDSERLDFDLSLAANLPTRSRDNRARVGMPNLAPTVELGPSVNLLLIRGKDWKLDLRLPVRTVFTVETRARDIGWTASPVLNLDVAVSGWDVTLQGGPVAASQAYHAYFYEVAPIYASVSRPAYHAPGGAAGWAFTALASRRAGPCWIGSYVQVDRLDGAVFAASPLVTARQNLSCGVGLSYVFKVSRTNAVAKPRKPSRSQDK
jgi:outer membrane scaffolding protein for murein synthesis (MipA/OmpV family)